MSPSTTRSFVLRASLMGLAMLGSAVAGCVLYVEDTDCGPNAYAYRGDCFCEDGYQGNDPYGKGCSPIMTFLITDDCDDGYDVAWKIWADERDWTWPSGDAVYVTPGYLYDQYETIECEQGELLCFGAESDGGLVYGVGLFNTESCDDCCFPCESREYDLGYITCN